MDVRAVLALLVAAAITAPVPADANCEGSGNEGYEYWDGHIVFEPQVGYAADRFLVVENRDVIALDRTGAVVREREFDLAANRNVRRIASSPDAHLVLGMSQVDSGDVVADLLGPDGGDVSRGLLIAEEPAERNFETPAVAWAGGGFDVAWIANDGWGSSTFWVLVARLYPDGTLATTPRAIAEGRRFVANRTQPFILPADGATWLLWDDETTVMRILGVRLDPFGLPIDAAPIEIATHHRMLAATARGGEAVAVAYHTMTNATVSLRLDASGPIGAPTSIATGLDPFEIVVYSARLAPRPDGYLLTWADGADGIPRDGSLTSLHLDPEGVNPTPYIADAGDAPAIATDGDGELVIAFAHDVLVERGEATSRLEVTRVHADGAADAPVVLREHDLSLENTGCGCSAADGAGLLPVLLALGLAGVISRRSLPSGTRGARSAMPERCA
jgi:MYXO-CTERM domain-containing protein